MLGPVALALAAYLVGSIPTGYLLGRLVKGIDIREHGTGNVGISNLWHNVGPAGAVIGGVLDLVKGAWPVFAARVLGYDDWAIALAVTTAVAGYAWSIYLKFSGGRGNLVSLGAYIAWNPLYAAIAFAFYATGIPIKRPAVTAFWAFLFIPFLGYFGGGWPWFVGALGLWAILLLKRLAGVREDLTLYPDKWRTIGRRLYFDRTPYHDYHGLRRERMERGARKQGR